LSGSLPGEIDAGFFPASLLNEKCVFLLPRASRNLKTSNFSSEISRQVRGLDAGCTPGDARDSGEVSVQFLVPERRNSIMASPKALPMLQNVLALPR
jgi:hypothetical protein